MKKYIRNIIVVCMVVILFFALAYFAELSFGLAHVALVATAVYALYLNMRELYKWKQH